VSLKDKYNIDDAAWKALMKQARAALFLLPSLFILLAGFTRVILEDFSWVPAIAVLWSLLYLPIVLFIRIWLIRAKFRLLVESTGAFLICMFFAIPSSACAYRFWGITGFRIQNLLMIAAAIFLSRYYYDYWDRVWESHEIYNETVALDLEKGRYGIINPFDTSEDKVKKNKTKKYSHSELIYIAAIVGPIGAAIPKIFSSHTTPWDLIIGWILGALVSLGFIKSLVVAFYLFKKLSYYEKKISKPIINGLLAKPRSRKAKVARQ
jgi:hypothetical protein